MLGMRIRSRVLPERCTKLPKKASQEALNVAAGADAVTRWREQAEGTMKEEPAEDAVRTARAEEAAGKEEEEKTKEEQAEEAAAREAKPVKADVEDLPKARAAREARQFPRSRIESGTNSSFLKSGKITARTRSLANARNNSFTDCWHFITCNVQGLAQRTH